MKLKSFGCSFTYGSDLSDCSIPENAFNIPGDFGPSQYTWPALLAKSLNYEYECYAQPGVGNLHIYYNLLNHVNRTDSDLIVVNWTWLDRFDFLDPMENETWNTLRPTGQEKEHQLYYKYFYNQYTTMVTNTTYIFSAVNLLKKYNKKFIMTAMDTDTFGYVDENWQDPKPVDLLQKEIASYMTWFDNQTFLNWSKKQGFKISDAWHPLEDAHQAAFELIQSYNLV
jgi:hypothetical protein